MGRCGAASRGTVGTPRISRPLQAVCSEMHAREHCREADVEEDPGQLFDYKKRVAAAQRHSFFRTRKLQLVPA